MQAADSAKTDENRPRSNYYTCRSSEDEFENPYLSEPNGDRSNSEFLKALEQTVKDAEENWTLEEKKSDLRKLISENSSIFCTSFPEGPSAVVKPLKINLATDARPMCVKLLNYSYEKRCFLKNILADFLQ